MSDSYQQALDYIWSFVDYETMPGLRSAANYDLGRVQELLARLDEPHLSAKSIHIAGTKGKGSTAAMVASALIDAGYSTGLYTSPHLNDPRERIRVNGELIGKEELVALVEKLKPEVEVVKQKATYGQLTTFEVLTVLGFAYFKLRGVDFQVIEVGLGGRLDATNVIHPEVCVITSISLDHTEVLGNSLTALAGEKAGIIKSDSTVVASPQRDEVARVIEEACLERGAGLIRVGRDVTWQGLGFDYDRQSLQVEGRLGSYKLSLPLLGQYQQENAVTAVAALEVLAEKGFSISQKNIVNGLAQTSWQGRFQVLKREPILVVDGAHNPDSARKLKQSLVQYFKFNRAILVTGLSLDKDMAGIVSELAPIFDEVIVTRSRHPRAMAPAPLAAEFTRYGVKTQVAQDVATALSLALNKAGAGDLVCAAGSLFVVAEVMEQIRE